MEVDFNGVKIALFANNKLIIIQRDDKPGLRFAGMWDLPGGARDDNESPVECVTREVKEELGIDLSPESIVWQKTYPSMHDPGKTAFFMAANVTPKQVSSIVFGDEGQGWKLITIEDLFAEQNFVAPLKDRLQDYLDSVSSGNKA